ncbi:MAG: 3-oxoacyl-[acyl-carrier-protein] reductase, partial [Pseudomonadota bacterium]
MFTIDLTGKRAWVTGASRGIGRAIALALAGAGCDVAIGYRHAEEEASEVAKAIVALGKRAHLARGHVGSSAECERMHSELVAGLGGPVDFLVNNAGIHKNGLFLTMEDADWHEVLETNLMGTVYPTRTVLKSMWGRKQGRIVNFSSVAAGGGGRGQANYAASKGAIEALTKNLAV